ncbi:MAG TPA: LytTR family transcriptional regulator [Bacteroidetes bacterium]|nr:LytTR family transcriptional regulator [Bacteroidota bacterium]
MLATACLKRDKTGESSLLARSGHSTFTHVTETTADVMTPAKYVTKMPKEKEYQIALPVKSGYRMVAAESIVRCEAAGNYTHVFLEGGEEIRLCKRLKEVEAMLSGEGFFRVHHSHLVNLGWINEWVTRSGDWLVLKEGSRVAISKTRKKALREKLKIIQ